MGASFRRLPGMIGFQILKRIGISTLGSGHATVESMLEDLKDSSGSKLKRTAEVWEGYTLPAEYLGNLQKLIYQPCLSMAPSSALCQGLHTASMRPLARLEYEALSCAILVDQFLPVALVVVEWESLPYAQGNMPHVNVKPKLLFIHGPKVLNNCLHMPNVRMADSMFREQTYREVLNS